MGGAAKKRQHKYNVGDIIQFDYSMPNHPLSPYYAIITKVGPHTYSYHYLDDWIQTDAPIDGMDNERQITLYA